MARCKECLHYEVCAKEGRLVQVDEHTWDNYNVLDDVEHFCTNYFTADVVPKSEVAREIFEEIDGITDLFAKGLIGELEMYDKLAELKKKYTGDK